MIVCIELFSPQLARFSTIFKQANLWKFKKSIEGPGHFVMQHIFLDATRYPVNDIFFKITFGLYSTTLNLVFVSMVKSIEKIFLVFLHYRHPECTRG